MPDPEHHPGQRVVVADDHPVYRDALCRAIAATGDLAVAGAAANGREALMLIERERPEVAVLDVEMPELTGPVVAARLTTLGLPTRVLFLSAHRTGATVYDALATGGFGYVTKDAPMRDIVEAIRRVARGERRLGLTVDDAVVAEIHSRATGADLRLTDREQAVLQLAVKGRTVVAMGKELHVSGATVKVHLSTLYAKLGVNDRASAVAEALRRGLVD